MKRITLSIWVINKVNWFNVLKNNIINSRKQHLIGNYTNKTQFSKQLQSSNFVNKTKIFKLYIKALKRPIQTILNIKLKNKINLMSSNRPFSFFVLDKWHFYNLIKNIVFLRPNNREEKKLLFKNNIRFKSE